MSNILKFKIPFKKRILRFYQRTAFKDHDSCWECSMPIMSGDQYHAKVFVYGRRLWVEKRHQNCPIDPDRDKEEREGGSITLKVAA